MERRLCLHLFSSHNRIFLSVLYTGVSGTMHRSSECGIDLRTSTPSRPSQLSLLRHLECAYACGDGG